MSSLSNGTEIGARRYMCIDCLLSDDGTGSVGNTRNIPGYWTYIGHGWEIESLQECETCKGEVNQDCQLIDCESSPQWECPGCGVTDILFNEMYLMERYL